MKNAICLAWILFCFASEAQTTQPATRPSIPDGVRVAWDVDYLPADRKEKADLYFPREMPASAVPMVIVIHGGGFNDGDKARAREINICTTLAAHGFACMSINYKLAKVKNKATWPQPVLDAKMAVKWLRNNADRLQIDPNRIAAFGCSAGGNLACMLLYTRPQDGLEPTDSSETSTGIKCAINFYGAVDLINYHDMKMFAKTREEAPELYKKASPITYVHKDAGPLLIVHGTADKVVDYSQSTMLADALNSIGAPCQLVTIPDAPHTFDLQPKQRDLRPVVIDFLNKHLKE